jgi:hypothetical protein
MLSLVKHTGLLEQSEPEAVSGYAVYTESALRNLSASELDEIFAANDIHVIPDHPSKTAGNKKTKGFRDMGFTAETCEQLEIDLDAEREFHGEFVPLVHVTQRNDRHSEKIGTFRWMMTYSGSICAWVACGTCSNLTLRTSCGWMSTA